MRPEARRPIAVAGGLILPTVVVLMAGLWVLALCALSLSSLSRRASRVAMRDLQAELAMKAGLADACARLLEIGGNDDFLIVAEEADGLRAPLRLHGVQPELDSGGALRFRYLALHSRRGDQPPTASLRSPRSQAAAQDAASLMVYPWQDPVSVAWLPVTDDSGRVVARYAFWMEDLQARLDPRLAAHPCAHPGFGEPPRAMPSLRALDSSPGRGGLERLIEGRDLLVSPDSALAAAGFQAPLERIRDGTGGQQGLLEDPWAAALERHTVVGIQSYLEQPRVPYLHGLSSAVVGSPRLNLNRLLGEARSEAVDEMAGWIATALPEFEGRGGGFPEDYLRTLAACALDYADADRQPSIQWGRSLGIDGQPFLSEVVLHIHYQGLSRVGKRWVMNWTLRLFAELWNPTSEPIQAGRARLSYEVHLKPSPVGLGAPGRAFDDPALLQDPRQSRHALSGTSGIYLTPEVEVVLPADGYRFHEFARVDYQIDCQPQQDALGQPLPEWFDLVEPLEEARGLTLYWNDQPVQRLHRILRDPHGLAGFRTDRSRKTAKACIPALNYGGYGAMINNPGDVRMAHYLRDLPLGENAYPENISPHRRNVRRRNIYDRDPTPDKARHYGRVMPSQWPDGGHDSATGNFLTTTSDAALPTDPGRWPLDEVPVPQPADAPQRISNAGRFFSTTEWGRIHDPLMWSHAYADREGHPGSGSEDTAVLTGRKAIWLRPMMPEGRQRWPGVSHASLPSPDHGGGHSLRIGRPEHSRFDRPGMRASHLLDLFHCGQPDAIEEAARTGPVVRVEGRVNLNTAHRDVLRCLVWGELRQDPAIAQVVRSAHDLDFGLRPHLVPWLQSPRDLDRIADQVADAILERRPFASPSELVQLRDGEDRPVFGDPQRHAPGKSLQWSDAAAEELFARVHDASCVRSRNFRIWLVGQALGKTREGAPAEILATWRRVFTVFVDPGPRDKSGALLSPNPDIRILHARSF